MWTEVGAGLETLNDRARGVALHAPPGVERAPWLSEPEATRWTVTFMVERDSFYAAGETPLMAVEEAIGLCPTGLDVQLGSVKDGIER